MSIIILDLDNCIADDEWRISNINWQHTDPFRRYHDYHLLSAFDSIGNRDLIDDNCEMAIFTARPIHYRATTEEWLRRNGINASHILMRNNDDHCSSVEIKRKQLWWLIGGEYGISGHDILCAYDDRPDVVDMYQKFGIHAEVRSIHNVCAYTQPEVK